MGLSSASLSYNQQGKPSVSPLDHLQLPFFCTVIATVSSMVSWSDESGDFRCRYLCFTFS